MSVIKPDFGLKKRRKAQRFRTLLRLDALHEANLRTNPLPYLERASERIFQLEKALIEAVAALKSSSAIATPPETIEVDKAEYQRLLRCRAIVETSFAQLGSAEDVFADDANQA